MIFLPFVVRDLEYLSIMFVPLPQCVRWRGIHIQERGMVMVSIVGPVSHRIEARPNEPSPLNGTHV